MFLIIHFLSMTKAKKTIKMRKTNITAPKIIKVIIDVEFYVIIIVVVFDILLLLPDV